MLNIQKYFIEGGLLSNLEKDPYNLKISKEYPFIIFKYNQISSSFSDSIVEESRGIILDERDWSVACNPFKKFYNFQEGRAANINLSKSTIFRKYDGSLIKVWYDFYNKKWRISTNGTIDANDAGLEFITSSRVSFYDLVIDVLDGIDNFNELTRNLDPKISYMFELLHPQNVIVEEHNQKQLVLIGAKDNMAPLSDYDIRSDKFKLFTEIENVSISKTFDIDKTSFEVIMKEASLYNSDESIFEGFVIAEIVNGIIQNRVKLKTPMYLKYHRLTDRKHSDNIFLEVFKNNEFEEFESYLDQAPDYAKERYFELKEMFEIILVKINFDVDLANKLFIEYKEKYTNNYQSEFGKMIQQNFKKPVQSIIFENIYKGITIQEYLSRMLVKKLKRSILNDI